MILSNEGDKKRIRIGKPIHRENHKYIFEKVGIMLHGKHSFCSKFAKIFRVRIVFVRALAQLVLIYIAGPLLSSLSFWIKLVV